MGLHREEQQDTPQSATEWDTLGSKTNENDNLGGEA